MQALITLRAFPPLIPPTRRNSRRASAVAGSASTARVMFGSRTAWVIAWTVWPTLLIWEYVRRPREFQKPLTTLQRRCLNKRAEGEEAVSHCCGPTAHLTPARPSAATDFPARGRL